MKTRQVSSAGSRVTRAWFAAPSVSDIVIREVQRGDAAMAEDRLAKIQSLPVLTLNDYLRLRTY